MRTRLTNGGPTATRMTNLRGSAQRAQRESSARRCRARQRQVGRACKSTQFALRQKTSFADMSCQEGHKSDKIWVSPDGKSGLQQRPRAPLRSCQEIRVLARRLVLSKPRQAKGEFRSHGNR